MLVNMAYGYFASQPNRAQLVALVLLANQGNRDLHNLLYNDGYLGFFVMATIYLVFKEQHFMATLTLNMAIAIKAGGMLLLPAFLSVTAYSFYPINSLLRVIIVSVTFQFILGYPFI